MSQDERQAQQEAAQHAATPAHSQFVSNSLYVGDLKYDVSENHLYQIFRQVGRVVSIRVCRDVISRQSLGHAYVNYDSAQNAKLALELLNFTPVNGQPIRITFSQSDGGGRESGIANVFINNLDKTIDSKSLFDTFSAFGPILSCKVATDASQQSKGHGFVQFEQEASAQTAIEKVNGMFLKEKQVFVGRFVRRQERESGGPSKFNNVYVKNIADSTTEEELRNRFGAFGTISSAVVMRDSEGKSKCFGFVNFEHSDDAAKAVAKLNGKKIDKKAWYVARAQKKSEREAELRARFEQEGKESIAIVHKADFFLKNLDEFDQSTHSGFGDFSITKETNLAVTDMNGLVVGSKPVYAALDQRKEDRVGHIGHGIWAATQINTPATPEDHIAQMHPPVGIGPAVPTSVFMFHPGYPGIQQVFYDKRFFHDQRSFYDQQNFHDQQNLYYQQKFYDQPNLYPHQKIYDRSNFYDQQNFSDKSNLYDHQNFDGQSLPGRVPLQPSGFLHQQQSLDFGPDEEQMRNCFVQCPNGPRHNQQGRQRPRSRPGRQERQQQQQQLLPRGEHRQFRSKPNATRNSPDAADSSLELNATLTADTVVPQPVPTSALASALASTPTEQQRAMLHEQLYPLVHKLEHFDAGKVTGMLLEMDQTEVLHLIESPIALMAKVTEAMEMLKMAPAAASPPLWGLPLLLQKPSKEETASPQSTSLLDSI